MTAFQFFSVSGRLSRGGFWLGALVVWLALYVAWAVVGMSSSAVLVWIINGIALLALVLLCVRRMHDRNHSGWRLLVVVIPVLGAMYLAWQLALRRGVPQDNRWGPDPLVRHGDYLVVR